MVKKQNSMLLSFRFFAFPDTPRGNRTSEVKTDDWKEELASAARAGTDTLTKRPVSKQRAIAVYIRPYRD
jgi:hypothetical protein